MSTATYRGGIYQGGLPWSDEPGEKRRLRLVAVLLLPLFLVVAGYITWVELPEQAREEREALPPQLAKLILEKKDPPKPIIKPEEKKPEPEKPKPEPEVAKPEPKPVPKPEPVKPKPEPKIVKKPEPTPTEVQQARDKAKQTGVLAMSKELSKLSSLADTVKLDTPNTVTAKPIARKSTDKLAAKAATTRSEGVDEAQLSQETQQLALAQRQQTEVRQQEQVAAAVEAEEKAAARNDNAQRSREELRRTMDANKSAIYSIYNRALRKQPSLQGQITPELVIEASGAVSSCSVVESTLNEPDLEQKICNRLRLVNFGSKPGVEQTTIRYPIELLSG
ncbi:hypothetical protein RE428_14520 [Marinobacter nanhaiticus D15-8W]|uniref:AgmX/PglI C-terminal domain-containing protein n=1 Tax=Marinobacter nanhaiticus D15-8W TaxID=626887 RepID=N6VYY4_9GAMM|nr:AgmX/PglI C-terminal domain-containing protein [Marinobacter nanhaiticus]ENO13079.1 hypothetical protein J057_16815 [Marinobacter nanhaiticus D15-8W]BES70434.1 hypothetical protein RE428_14520 [Marinobacter nanhaiticus D15-8W]